MDFIPEPLLRSRQLGAENSDLRGIFGLYLGATLPLGVERYAETLDFLLERPSQARVTGSDIVRPHRELRLERRVSFGVILFDQPLMVALDVVGANQLGEEGRRHVERYRDDQNPHKQTEKPSGAPARLSDRIAAKRFRRSGRALGHNERRIDDPDDREHQHEHEKTRDRAEPGGRLRDDRGADETPNDRLDTGHQQDDDKGKAQPNRHRRGRQAVAIGS